VTLLIPDRIGEDSIDLRGHFLGLHRVFMAVMLAFILLGWLDGPLLQGPGGVRTARLDPRRLDRRVAVGLSTDDDRVNSTSAAVWIVLVMISWFVRFFPGTFGP